MATKKQVKLETKKLTKKEQTVAQDKQILSNFDFSAYKAKHKNFNISITLQLNLLIIWVALAVTWTALILMLPNSYEQIMLYDVINEQYSVGGWILLSITILAGVLSILLEIAFKKKILTKIIKKHGALEFELIFSIWVAILFITNMVCGYGTNFIQSTDMYYGLFLKHPSATGDVFTYNWLGWIFVSFAIVFYVVICAFATHEAFCFVDAAKKAHIIANKKAINIKNNK